MDAEVDAGGGNVAGQSREGGGRGGEFVADGRRVVETAAAEHVPKETAFRPDAGWRTDRLTECLGPLGHVHPGAGSFSEAHGGQPPGGQLHERRVKQILHNQLLESGKSSRGGGVDPGLRMPRCDPRRRGVPTSHIGHEIIPGVVGRGEEAEHLLDATPIGAFLRADREAARERLVSVLCRYEAEGEIRIRID